MRKASSVLEKLFEETIVKLFSRVVLTAPAAVRGYLFGTKGARERYEQKIRAAPEEYVRLLKTQINGDDLKPVGVPIQARSIVRVRDDLSGSLANLGKLLETEIDALAQLVQKYEQTPTPEIQEEMSTTITVLRHTWPAKEVEIKCELRKQLAELGLDQVDEGPKHWLSSE